MASSTTIPYCTQSWFSFLPIEITAKILSYLTTYEAFQLSAVFPNELAALTYSTLLLHWVRLPLEYRLRHTHVSEYLLHPRRRNLITNLDISHSYWLSKNDLRRLVRRLPNLSTLYAYGTNLTSIDLSMAEKLGTVGLSYFESLDFPCTVTKAYLNVCNSTYSLAVRTILHMKMLKIVHLRLVGNEVYYGEKHTYTLRLNARQLTISFSNFKWGFDTEVEYLFSDARWTVVQKDIKKMDDRLLRFKDHASLDSSIPYEEVDLAYPPKGKCTIDELSIFESNLNLTRLKRLTITWRNCERKIEEKEMRVVHLFKKPRLQKRHVAGTSVLEGFVERYPWIEVLKIVEAQPIENYESLRTISSLSNLKRLEMTFIPAHTNISFLVEVGKTCLQLASVRLHLKNNSSSHYVYSALTYMTSLEDLIISQYWIDLSRLVKSLGRTVKTVRRLSLFSKELLGTNLIEQLLCSNPQLVFCCISVHGNNTKLRNELKRIFKTYKNNPTQLFTWNFLSDKIPEIHQDMVFYPYYNLRE